ncbi:N-acyl amino acid synthase FeeM domain-containing protein [Novipirellula artificiosorum]|nr:hypothetical protein [Novipirellula artificiosorum]
MDRNTNLRSSGSESTTDQGGRVLPFPGQSLAHAPTNRDCVEYRTARSHADFRGAFELLQARYAEAGLATANAKSLRVLPYHLWTETQIFVAVKRTAAHRDQIIGSVSLVCDGNSGGIPMESTFGEAVTNLRRKGVPFGEVCSLCVESLGARSSVEMFGQLTRIMMYFARRRKLQTLLAVVHPRHSKFYQHAMGFQPIGGSAPYRQVGGQPGIPVLGSVNDQSQYRARWRKYYFDGVYDDAELQPYPMNQIERIYFQSYMATDQAATRAA